MARRSMARLPAAAFAFWLALTLAGCAAPPARPAVEAAPAHDVVGLFPMDAYDQNVDHWIDPHDAAYDRPFLSAAQQRAHEEALYARYFGTGSGASSGASSGNSTGGGAANATAPSPWNPAYIEQVVYRDGGDAIAALQRRRLSWFDNRERTGRHIGYGQNFRPHTGAWIDAIAKNMNVAQFEGAPHYAGSQRAIATGNLLVRELPTMDPSFYDWHIAGEGYPFDNLQISAVRPGTPLYVLGSSADGAWRYVQTPDLQGWVQSDHVGTVDDAFVLAWRAAAGKMWGAVIAASAPVSDSQGTFRFNAPAGSLLPLQAAASSSAAGSASASTWNVLVPARDIDGRAVIRTATLDASQIAPMPLAATPRNLAMLLKNLIGRPYGWGNTGFYNDCSSELQSIFAAFGVWLPRHSSTQMSAGRMTDLSDASPTERLDYLAHHGVPMRTLIYIGGHVMLYLGNTTRDGKVVPVVYQDVWGLRPADNSRRAVIGGSVILPLLARIPEDPSLESLAGTPTFQISVIGGPDEGGPSQGDEDNPAS
ncbi:SH3 domain-containing C40 family peptidase [Paraburkholderia sp. SUR17]|uniref:SH3 domain-containing C40 family peptidase n=1 Tax=Paraburkholderia sp. SUR17 TaxID=3034358 RepID=UPI0024079411|nr:SH3 domain-containing C40 family peptidase [Paraburkholderia sp. SUR17]WEY41659.1 SH3 domain-containing protein [Paraburkholderia sp. SUR17]